jgi:hypothetical protein
LALTRRVELLFDPDQYSRLEEIARSRGVSVAAVIRSAVDREDLRPALAEKRVAVEELLRVEAPVGTWEEVKEDILEHAGRQFEAP